MTAASPLTEKVAKALSQWMNGARLPSPPNWERLQESTRQAYRDQAQAALNACRAEETRAIIGKLMSACVGTNDFSTLGVMEEAEALLAKLDHISTEQPA